MPGRVDDCDLGSAKVRQESGQTSLADYGGEETFVGIVHSPSDDFLDTVDYNDERLAPPHDLFEDWKSERSRLYSNGISDPEAHNTAFDSVTYRKRFREHLDEHTHALDEYAERVARGETIVFVCFCTNGKYCHRRMVKDTVYQRLPDDD